MTDSQEESGADLSTTELIALGRDREAVDAATRDLASHPRQPSENDDHRGVPMDGVQQLDEIIPMLEGVVGKIAPEQLDNPTPCASFSVAGVLEHMIGGATAFAPAFRGAGSPATAASGGTVQERWGDAMAELLAAVHTAGAQERTIASPFGEVPGSMFARYVAFDGLVHGWDLATAIGLPYDPDALLVAEVDTFARGLLQPQMRDGDTFAAETSVRPDASPIERLAAFSGRTVATTESAR